MGQHGVSGGPPWGKDWGRVWVRFAPWTKMDSKGNSIWLQKKILNFVKNHVLSDILGDADCWPSHCHFTPPPCPLDVPPVLPSGHCWERDPGRETRAYPAGAGFGTLVWWRPWLSQAPPITARGVCSAPPQLTEESTEATWNLQFESHGQCQALG